MRDLNNMNTSDRQALVDTYIDHVIDGMDMKDLMMFVADAMADRLADYSDTELVEEVREYYPFLIDEV